MQRDERSYLWDVLNSIDLIFEFIADRTIKQYSGDAMLRSAVERQLAIVGEAVAQLDRRFPQSAGRITCLDAIVGFRNILVHGYSFVSDPIVWSVIHSDLPFLREEVAALLRELEA